MWNGVLVSNWFGWTVAIGKEGSALTWVLNTMMVLMTVVCDNDLHKAVGNCKTMDGHGVYAMLMGGLATIDIWWGTETVCKIATGCERSTVPRSLGDAPSWWGWRGSSRPSTPARSMMNKLFIPWRRMRCGGCCYIGDGMDRKRRTCMTRMWHTRSQRGVVTLCVLTVCTYACHVHPVAPFPFSLFPSFFLLSPIAYCNSPHPPPSRISAPALYIPPRLYPRRFNTSFTSSSTTSHPHLLPQSRTDPARYRSSTSTLIPHPSFLFRYHFTTSLSAN